MRTGYVFGGDIEMQRSLSKNDDSELVRMRSNVAQRTLGNMTSTYTPLTVIALKQAPDLRWAYMYYLGGDGRGEVDRIRRTGYEFIRTQHALPHRIAKFLPRVEALLRKSCR